MRPSLRALLIALWLAVAWSGAAPQEERLVDVDVTGDAGQSYVLFAPAGEPPAAGWPAIYCFDPRGRGRLCAELYLPAARRHRMVVASSNNARSDGPMEPNLRAMKALWKDAHERLPLDDRRAYTTGFSGGARVANLLARVLGLAGVIAHGAGFPPSTPPVAELPFDHYALIGDLDFNYYEVLALGSTLDRLGLRHHVELFEGSHQWAGAAECSAAVDWMQRRAIERGLIPLDRELVEAGWEAALRRGEEARAAGRLVEALEDYRAAARDFEPWLDVEIARRRAERLEADPAVRKELRLRRRLDAWAARYLDGLAVTLERLRTPALAPPEREILISRLQIRKLLRRAGPAGRAGQATNEEQRAARRLLNMVLVQTGFTQVQALRAEKQYARAALALEVAVAVAPESPVHWYNLACYRALAGQPDRALDALERAVENGYEDLDAAARDDDLRSLRELERFRTLLRREAPLRIRDRW